jgi:hypothetical protein
MSFTRRRQLDDALRRLTRQCEQRETCSKHSSNKAFAREPADQHEQEMNEIETIHCVRRCISPMCYRDIYQNDPLERGEIDVRFNLFKTCWINEQKA